MAVMFSSGSKRRSRMGGELVQAGMLAGQAVGAESSGWPLNGSPMSIQYVCQPISKGISRPVNQHRSVGWPVVPCRLHMKRTIIPSGTFCQGAFQSVYIRNDKYRNVAGWIGGGVLRNNWASTSWVAGGWPEGMVVSKTPSWMV